MSRPGRPTLADVAREAGVGIATVDRVLNRRAAVRSETVRRVVEAAQAIGFHGTPLLRKRLEHQGQDRTFAFLLQKASQSFYRDLAHELLAATRNCPGIRGRAIIHHLDDLAPAAVAKTIGDLAARADGLAIVAADHPRVAEAVEAARGRGRPVVTLLSDLSTPARTAFVGIDHRKAGRTAGWAIARLARRPGKVGIFVGSHRYLGHDLCEISFRSYLREHAPDMAILEPMATFEEARFAGETLRELLRRSPDLTGLYVAGAGIEGVIETLRDEAASRDIVVIGNELGPETRAALIDGIVDLVIATPVPELARVTLDVLVAATNGSGTEPAPCRPLAFDLFTAENI